MEKVSVYLSVKNKNSDSLQSKIQYIKNWCLFKNYDCDFYVDKIESRLDCKNRNDMNRLKENILNKKVNKVIVPNIENIGRNNIFVQEFLCFLDKHDCIIESIDGSNLNFYRNITNEILNNYKEDRER